MPNVSQPVLEAMAELNERVREVQTARGVLGVAAVAIASLLGIMLLDLLLSPPERWMQIALSFAGLVIVLTAAWRWLFRPSIHRHDPVALARHLESVHPELEERLSSAIELDRHPDPGVSPEMVDSVIHQAVADVGELDIQQEVSTRSLRTFRRAALFALALFLLALAVQPGKSVRLMGRALLPWMDIGNAWSGDMSVTPGDRVILRGSPLDIAMEMDTERHPLPVFIEREQTQPHATERHQERLPLRSSTGQTHRYALHIPQTNHAFRYRFRSGRKLTAWYHIRTAEPPAADHIHTDIVWPEYTGWPESQTTNDTVRTFAGSLAAVYTAFNKPVREMGLWAGTPRRIHEPAEIGLTDARWVLDVVPELDGPLEITFSDEHGFKSRAIRTLDVVEDTPPLVDLRLPVEQQIRLRPDATLRLGTHIEDDVGVDHMEMVVEGAGEQIRRAVPEALATTREFGTPATLDIGSVLELASVDLRKTRFLNVWVEVRDLKGQIGRSRTLEVAIEHGSDSQFEQEIARQAEAARRELEATLQALQDAQAAASDGSPQEVADRARAAHEQTEAFADALEDSALAPLAEAARQAAETHTRPAAQQAELVPLANNQAEETARRRMTAQELAAAESSLQAMNEQLAALTEQLQAMANLMELADREHQIAEEAASLPPEPDEAFETLQTQQAETTLDIGQSVQSDPAAAAEQRSTTARSASELAEAAESLAAEQADLNAASDATRHEALRSALEAAIAAQQSDLAQQAEPTPSPPTSGDAPQEEPPASSGAEQASEASEAMERGDLDAARSAAAEAAKAFDADGQTERSDHQEQLAEQMEALSEGDLEAALQAAQEGLADMAADLAERTKALAAAEAAAGQEPSATGALEAAQQMHASGERNDAEGLEQAAEALRQLAEQAAAQALGKPDTGPNSEPNSLAQALEAASEATAATTANELEGGAAEAADALRQAAQALAGQLGMQENIPGLPQPGPSDGMQVPMAGSGQTPPQNAQAGTRGAGRSQQARAQGQGGEPGDEPGGQEGESPRGGGAPDTENMLPPALAKLGLSQSDWSRLSGKVNSRSGRSRASGVPPEYRQLVEQYFEAIASGKAGQ